ncbi:MAG: DUF547 domain-containing protein [Nitrospira sp.]|nr:DUF547 domain-containing protein [Nitrospira sp.]
MKLPLMFIISLALSMGCSTIPSTFTPSHPISPATFTHENFDQALARNVKDGVVDYPAFANDFNFKSYINLLQQIAPQQLPTPNHRLAFWINAYNALTIQGIIDGYSPATMAGRYTFFISREYVVGGELLNLYDLEQHLLIPDFKEPRIHFAIVCASQSCPKLQPAAYTQESLDQQLTASAQQFINDPTRNRFDRQRHIAFLSKIFDWFSGDFINHSGSLPGYVAQFVADPDLANDLRQNAYTIEFLDYDWSLNGVPPLSH